MADKDTLIEKLHDHLFDERDNLPIHFDKDEQEIAIRLRDTFTKMLDCPHLSDAELIVYMTDTYGISKQTAYRDLGRTKSLLGNVRSTAKEFQRYTADQMVREGYKVALEANSMFDIKRGLAMMRAGETLVKIHKLDKDEGETKPWENIIPIELESSDDVSIVPGHVRKYQSREELQAFQEKLRKKYGGDRRVTEAQIVE